MSTNYGAERAVQPLRQRSEVVEFGARLARSAFRNKWVRAGTGLWILGLLVVFVLPAPIATTEESLVRYEEKLLEVNAANKRLEELEDDWFQADIELRSEAGWFSWFAPPEQKEVIANFRRVRDDLKVKVNDAEHALLLAQREANKQLGLFSSYGKAAATDRLWDSFERAKLMGRRQTFFDGLGTIIFNRDRDLMEIVVRVAVYLVLNIAWAMFFMFWVFIAGLPRLIWTFGATWTECAAFFFLAAIGAAAVMATFTTLLGAATAGAIYGVAHFSDRMGRLGGPTADGRRRLHGSVPGYSNVDFGTERYFRPQRHGAFTGADATPAAAVPPPHYPTGHLHTD